MKSIVMTLVLSLFAANAAASDTEFSESELADLGRSYAQATNDLNADRMTALISARHLARNIAEIVGDDEDEKQSLYNSFRTVVPNLSKRLLAELERQNARAVYLRVHEFDGMRGPLVRYNVGDGYNYVLLLPVRPERAKNGVLIGDLYYATSGELLSQTIGVAAKLASAPSETFLGKLLGTKEFNQDLVATFQQVSKLRQQNRLQEAYDVLNAMEGNLRNHRLILMNTIQITSQMDENLYRQELGRLARFHKNDPRAAFTLLDYYFYENDLDSAMDIIDLMEASYGDDAVLNIFRTSVELARSRTSEALAFANKAVRLEPDNEDARWTLLTAFVQSGMFAESVSVLEYFESDYSYVFTREEFEADPMYSDFVKSREFAAWID